MEIYTEIQKNVQKVIKWMERQKRSRTNNKWVVLWAKSKEFNLHKKAHRDKTNMNGLVGEGNVPKKSSEFRLLSLASYIFQSTAGSPQLVCHTKRQHAPQPQSRPTRKTELGGTPSISTSTCTSSVVVGDSVAIKWTQRTKVCNTNGARCEPG